MKTQKDRLGMDERLNQDQLGLSKPQHTPTPWPIQKITGGNGHTFWRVFVKYDQARDAHDLLDFSREDDAVFVCHAVNAYEELLGTLREVERYFNMAVTTDEAKYKEIRAIWELVSKTLANAEGKDA